MPGRGYQLTTLIGSGGMGRVYRAVQLSTGQIVAVKLLRADVAGPAVLTRFVREARALATLNHPNVIRLYDFVPDPNDPYLVMEYIEGKSLSKLAGAGKLPAAEAAVKVSAAARGVHAAHEKGIVHRDLKPGNLLVTSTGEVKVADFGLCKWEETDETLTQYGHIVGGTPGFMAPEQADPSSAECDPRTDVWGLGATLYALLVGCPPYPTGSKNALKVLSEPFTPPRTLDRTIPRELDAIVCKCLDPNRANRYATAAAVADDLDNWQAGKPTVARPMGWTGRAWKRLRRLPRAVVTAWVLAAVVLLVVTPIALIRRKAVDPLAERQAMLRAGREVVLVDQGHFQLEPKWLLGDAVLNRPTEEEPYTSFATRDRVMLTVMPDPGVDRYRIAAQIKQLPVTAEVESAVTNQVGFIGVYWGYREVEFPDGLKVKVFLSLWYNDYQPNPLKPRNTYLRFHHAGQVEDPASLLGPLPIPSAHEWVNSKLDIVRSLPGPTRTLTIDVMPNEIALNLPNGRKVFPPPELETQLDRLENSLRQSCNGRVLGTQTWSPRSPVGLIVDRARIAVERFVISPLPD
jgi:hypothetical protein